MAMNTPPKYTACIHTPTIAEVDHAALGNRGAFITKAITYSNTAAHNILTVRNANGPAWRVLYRATTNPVLHNATKIHGAERSNTVADLVMQVESNPKVLRTSPQTLQLLRTVRFLVVRETSRRVQSMLCSRAQSCRW